MWAGRRRAPPKRYVYVRVPLSEEETRIRRSQRLRARRLAKILGDPVSDMKAKVAALDGLVKLGKIGAGYIWSLWEVIRDLPGEEELRRHVVDAAARSDLFSAGEDVRRRRGASHLLSSGTRPPSRRKRVRGG